MDCVLEKVRDYYQGGRKVFEDEYLCKSDIASHVLVERNGDRYRFTVISSRIGDGRVYMYFLDTLYPDSIIDTLFSVLDRYSTVVARVGNGLLVGSITDLRSHSDCIIDGEDLLDALFSRARCVVTPFDAVIDVLLAQATGVYRVVDVDWLNIFSYEESDPVLKVSGLYEAYRDLVNRLIDLAAPGPGAVGPTVLCRRSMYMVGDDLWIALLSLSYVLSEALIGKSCIIRISGVAEQRMITTIEYDDYVWPTDHYLVNASVGRDGRILVTMPITSPNTRDSTYVDPGECVSETLRLVPTRLRLLVSRYKLFADTVRRFVDTFSSTVN